MSLSIEQLVERPVVRKYMDCHWLKKISSSEFKAWEARCRTHMESMFMNEADKDQMLIGEILRIDVVYLEAKKLLETKSTVTFDLTPKPSLRDAVIALTASTIQTRFGKVRGLDTKHIPIGYRKTAIDYLKEAELNVGCGTNHWQDNKLNGREYPKNYFRENYKETSTNWMTGGYDYP